MTGAHYISTIVAIAIRRQGPMRCPNQEIERLTRPVIATQNSRSAMTSRSGRLSFILLAAGLLVCAGCDDRPSVPPAVIEQSKSPEKKEPPRPTTQQLLS